MSDPAVVALAEALADRYRLERELGRGGMATVWLARDLKHDRLVALKLLRPEFGAILGAERFLREIRLTANLQHPRILPLHDSGIADGRLFYVMPYVEGESLRDRLARDRQVPLHETARIVAAVASALDYAHERGIVHRDIKPENVLLTPQGDPLVADFGIARATASTGEARLTDTGLALGTPAYMAPEQATGDPIDPRTDVCALGCVVYEMLAGVPPYIGATAQAVIAKRLGGVVPRLSTVSRVPSAVEAAVTRALAPSPADRFESTGAFAAALTASALTASALTASASHSHAVSERGRRLRRAGLGAAGLLVIGLGALVASRRVDQDAPRAVAPAQRQFTFTAQASEPALAPDGRSMAYVSGRRSLVRRQLVAWLPQECRFGFVSMSGYARHVACAVLHEEPDVWLVSDFERQR